MKHQINKKTSSTFFSGRVRKFFHHSLLSLAQQNFFWEITSSPLLKKKNHLEKLVRKLQVEKKQL